MYLPLAALVCLVVLLLLYTTTRVFMQRASQTLAMTLCTTVIVVALSGLTYRRNQDYRSSISIWSSNVAVAPGAVAGWSNLGIAHKDADQLPEAVAAFRTAAELQPTPDRLASLAAALIESNDVEEASVVLQRALQLDPFNYLTVLNQGNLMFKTGRYAEAVDFFRAALQVKADDVATRTSLGACLVFTQRFSEAKVQCERVLAIAPDSVMAMVNLACVMAAEDNSQRAIRLCEKALRIDPDCSNAHGTLAMVLLEKQPAKAEEHLVTACELEKDLPMYDIALGDMQLSRNPDNAICSFQSALEKQPDSIEARLGLVEAYKATGRREAAILELKKLIKQKPDWLELQRELVRLRYPL
ncbi:MAG: hypothetical protein Aurels2KO_30710 [Aureliella sp.]